MSWFVTCLQHFLQKDDKQIYRLISFVLCEERTSEGIETKHGQSSMPFLLIRRYNALRPPNKNFSPIYSSSQSSQPQSRQDGCEV